MNEKLQALLVCPVCKGALELRADAKELVCLHDRLAFPLRNDIPVLVTMDARQLDEHCKEDKKSG